MRKINVIIAGSTGMIGESVLDQCLKNDFIDKVLIINRSSTDLQHPKLKEAVMSDLSYASMLKNIIHEYDACFFCIGVSSLGMDEASYTRLTYTMTLNFAKLMSEFNPAMTFCYISGAGTDSTQTGKTMWARVKGKTENDLLKLPFKQVYNFRPGALIPYLKVKPNQTYQSVKYIKWLMILLRPIFPNHILRMSELANAMINSALIDYHAHTLEARDIKKLSEMKIS